MVRRVFHRIWSTSVETYVLLTKHEVNMGGYWLSSFLPFLWPGTMGGGGGDPQKCKKRLVNGGFII